MRIDDARTRGRVLAVLFFGVLMGALDIAIVGPALPVIRSAFAVGERAIGWVFSIYVLFNLVGTPLMARLSDLYGRRSLYAADVALFALGSLAVAAAPSFAVVLIGRGLQGFGAGGIFPVASAVIGDTFPPEKRGAALGLIGAVFGFAFIIGPVLGGVLLLAGWRWLFLVNLPIAAALFVLSLRILPADRPGAAAPFDLPGMALLGAGLAAFAFGINRIETGRFLASLASAAVLPYLAAAALLLPLFARVERRAAAPLLRLELLRSRQMALGCLLATGAGLGESALVFIPALAVAAFAVPASTTSFLLLPVVLAMSVGAPLSGRLLDRLGSRRVVLAGTSLFAAGMAVLGLFGSVWAPFLAAGALIGVGLSALLGAPLRYIVLNEAGEGERSVAQGVVSLFTSAGQLTGAAVVGAVAASGGGGVRGYGAAYLTVAAVALLLLPAAAGLKRRAQELPPGNRS